MIYEKNRVKDLKIAYVGGGSRGWAWGFMTDLTNDGQLCGTVRLYDIDREAAEKNARIGRRLSEHPEAKSRWSYEVSGSLEEALAGADFVVISILPGTFDEMESDVHLPERVGVYQSVGDTVGPGRPRACPAHAADDGGNRKSGQGLRAGCLGHQLHQSYDHVYPNAVRRVP